MSKQQQCIFSVLFIFFIIIVNINIVHTYIRPLGEEEYQVILSLVKGTFNNPKNERTNIEKAAVIKFWRANGRFTADNNGKVLFYDGKVVRKNLYVTFHRKTMT